MEALNRTYQQFLNLFQSMSPSQRAILIVVPLMVISALGFLMFSGTSSSYVAASWGKVFPSEDLIHAEQALIDAGLTDFHRRGQLIMVPRSEVDQYNAALLSAGSLPTNWAEELENQLESTSGPFTSQAERQERKDIALAAALSQVIQAVPGIDNASVIWARPERRSHWPRRSKVTATINVQPRHDHELSIRTVQSMRTMVANAVADLNVDDVTVFNQATGMSHPTGNEDESFDNRLVNRIRQFEQLYRSKIQDALSYIDKSIVTVNVDLEKVKSLVERTQKVDPEQTVPLRTIEQSLTSTTAQKSSRAEPGQVSNQPRSLQVSSGGEKNESKNESNNSALNAASFTISEKEFLTAMPEAVQVTTSIPEEYYRGVAAQEGHSPGETEEEKQAFETALTQIRTRVESDVKAKIENLIPADSPDGAINVSSHLSLNQKQPKMTVPFTQTIWTIFSQWGGALGLALFAAWSLWMLNKSTEKVDGGESFATAPSMPHPQLSPEEEEEDEEELEDSKPKQPSKRDQLQNIVRDNPEMAATVISKWIQAAK